MNQRHVSFHFLPAVHLYDADIIADIGLKPILMVEDPSVFSRRKYHQQKLALILASMRNLAASLRAQGMDLIYYDLDSGHTIKSAIEATARNVGATHFSTFAVADRTLNSVLDSSANAAGITRNILDSPSFLGTKQDFASFRKQNKALRMSQFYQHQRKHLRILIDESGRPEGGKWSFDSENRQKVPARQAIPCAPTVEHNETSLHAMHEIARRYPDNPGDAMQLWLPSDRRGAVDWLDRFVKERLTGFGTYEDAMTQRSELLFHGALSPLLNIGTLTPREVINAALTHPHVPINDLEGFIRQVIGWREFIHGFYVTEHELPDSEITKLPIANKRSHSRQFTQHWYDGTTGIPPLDQAIHTMLHKGWNHHIERLMIMANMMNLCEIEPNSVYDYFMAHHIDAYDWVMRPNIEGMGLASAQNSFATKPYVCSSNYMLKMSDHSRGEWTDVVDGLYWRFIERNRDEFSRNPRTALTTKALDRMPPERKTSIFSSAEHFLAEKTV